MSKRIVIVAGEESGDIHSANLIRDLKQKHHDIIISGIGGNHMKNAGADLIYNLASYGVTGISEVIKHLRTLKKAFNTIQRHLEQVKPDLLILVDYPGFNLRLAKFAKEKLNIQILYYISPQIWAWKAKRVYFIKKYIDHMAVILPFEKSIYEKHDVPVSYVGHPLVTEMSHEYDKLESRKKLKLPSDKKIIALLPGSRGHEINKHMPVLNDLISKFNREQPEHIFCIPLAQTVSKRSILKHISNKNLSITKLIDGNAKEVMSAADSVVVASGTASLECALLKKPMCIIYKSSWFSYYAAMKLVKVKYLGLCNIIANRLIVPEFLQDDFTAEEIYPFLCELLVESSTKLKMLSDLIQLQQNLSSKNADCSLLQLIENQLQIDSNK